MGRGSARAGGRRRAGRLPPSRGVGASPLRAILRAVDAQFLTIISAVLAVGFGLAGLMIRAMSRIDRRIDSGKAAADTDRRAHQAAMDAFRTEMQRLAERQSHVEGRVAERGTAAD